MIGQRVCASLAFSLVAGQAIAAPITFNTGLPVGQGKFIVREQIVVSRSGDDPLGIGRKTDSRSLLSVVAYGVSAKLALFTVLPYTSKRAESLVGSERSSDGWGDLTVFGRYTLYQRDWSGRTLRVAGIAGLKAPTGSDNESDALGRLPAALQPGTGSWDGFVGGVVSYQTLAFGLDAQLSYRQNREANGFEAGNETRLDVSYQHRLRPSALTADTRGFLYGVLELNTVYRDQNKQNGGLVDDSGGTTVFITPGVQYATRKLIAEIAVQIPIVQNLKGNTLENDFVVHAGFRINF